MRPHSVQDMKDQLHLVQMPKHTLRRPVKWQEDLYNSTCYLAILSK